MSRRCLEYGRSKGAVRGCTERSGGGEDSPSRSLKPLDRREAPTEERPDGDRSVDPPLRRAEAESAPGAGGCSLQ